MARHHCNEQNANFFRLSFLLHHYGLIALREAIRFIIKRDCPALPTLQDVLADRRVKATLLGWSGPGLTREQKVLLYPGGGRTAALEDLDISLACFLIRNVPLFVGPHSTTVWSSPIASDLIRFPLESNVCLLRKKRNTAFGHLNKPELAEGDFLREFHNVKEFIANIMDETGSRLFDKTDLESVKTQPVAFDSNVQMRHLFFLTYL